MEPTQEQGKAKETAWKTQKPKRNDDSEYLNVIMKYLCNFSHASRDGDIFLLLCQPALMTRKS